MFSTLDLMENSKQDIGRNTLASFGGGCQIVIKVVYWRAGHYNATQVCSHKREREPEGGVEKCDREDLGDAS